MQIDESFELPFSRDSVWRAFQNLGMLIDCLPGARLLSPAGQTPLELAFKLKMGPIVAAFSGQGDVAYDPQAFTGRFSGQGTDPKNNSRVKGEARFALLEAAGPVTTVKVSVEFALTGTLAQFGRIGIVKEIAAGLTAQFAANLKRQLVPEALTPAAPSLASDQAADLQVNRSFNLGSMLWQLLKQRLKRLFGRG